MKEVSNEIFKAVKNETGNWILDHYFIGKIGGYLTRTYRVPMLYFICQIPAEILPDLTDICERIKQAENGN